MKPKIVTIIPNYNGVGIIEKCLNSLPDYLNVFVIDDASTDDSVELIANSFPRINILHNEKNSGFSSTMNCGIRNTQSDYILVLNNDVCISDDLLENILDLFDDETVFSVGPSILLPCKNMKNEGIAFPKWHHGILFGDQKEFVNDVTPILYTTGCAAVYRRSMLEALGGFDEAYSPFYWEDVDLCYRAWKRGWKSLYQPKSAVIHKHSASISKIKASYTDRIKARNSLFFIWRNIEDKKILSNHKMWLPLVLSKKLASGDLPYLKGWHDAWERRDEAVSARISDSANRVMSDREIFEAVGIDIL